MMNQLRFRPPEDLQGAVYSLWYFREAQDYYDRHAIYPDSYREIIFNLQSPLFMFTESGKWIELPKTYLSPIQSRPQKLHATGHFEVMAASLYPWGLTALKLNDVPTYQGIGVMPGPWQHLADSLQSVVRDQGYVEGIARLAAFVRTMYHGVPTRLTAVARAGERIYKQRGHVKLLTLAAESYLSQSQFERQFKYAMGTTPKTYARLVRFETVRNTLFWNPTHGLAELATDFGYTDQAHFTRDFKAFAQETPSQFLTKIADYAADWQPADFLQYR